MLWTEQFGSSEYDAALAVASDPAGNAFVAGFTWGDLEGALEGATDAFVRAFRPDGTAAWTRQFGTVAEDAALAVATDMDGNVIVAGTTLGDLEGASAGGYDVFVRKYDASGNLGWTHQFGTGADDGARAITTDSAGNVVVTDFTLGSLDGEGAGGSDVFVRKLTPEGTSLWTRQFGTSAVDASRGIGTDSADNIIIAGYTEGALGGVAIDSQDNIVVASHTNGELKGESAGDYDAFVVRFDPDGEMVWTEQFGTSGDDRVRGVATDPQRNVIIAGNTSGVLAGGGGGQDVFVRAYEP